MQGMLIRLDPLFSAMSVTAVNIQDRLMERGAEFPRGLA